eukprot:4885956-Pyramimonas_sp.AAC.1
MRGFAEDLREAKVAVLPCHHACCVDCLARWLNLSKEPFESDVSTKPVRTMRVCPCCRSPVPEAVHEELTMVVMSG